jgi:hypothetical protein
MRIIKGILKVLVVLILTFLLVSLFIEGDYSVEKEVIIRKQNQEVFAYVRQLKNQGEYSVWHKMDPKMKKSYIGKDGEVGFVYAWESNNENVGKGELEIAKIQDDKRIDMELRFFEPFQATNTCYMTSKPLAEDLTKVTWGFKGSMPYPFQILKYVMNMEVQVGEDLDKGLKNLKKILEK